MNGHSSRRSTLFGLAFRRKKSFKIFQEPKDKGCSGVCKISNVFEYISKR